MTYAIIKIDGLYIEKPIAIETNTEKYYILSQNFIKRYFESETIKRKIISGSNIKNLGSRSPLYDKPIIDAKSEIYVAKEVNFDARLKDEDEINNYVDSEFKKIKMCINYIFRQLFNTTEIIIVEQSKIICRLLISNNTNILIENDDKINFRFCEEFKYLLTEMMLNMRYDCMIYDIEYFIYYKNRTQYSLIEYFLEYAILERMADYYLDVKGIVTEDKIASNILLPLSKLCIVNEELKFDNYSVCKKIAKNSKIAKNMKVILFLDCIECIEGVRDVVLLEKFYKVYNVVKHQSIDEDSVDLKCDFQSDKEKFEMIDDFERIVEKVIYKMLTIDCLNFDKKHRTWEFVPLQKEFYKDNIIEVNDDEVDKILNSYNFNFDNFKLDHLKRDRLKKLASFLHKNEILNNDCNICKPLFEFLNNNKCIPKNTYLDCKLESSEQNNDAKIKFLKNKCTLLHNLDLSYPIINVIIRKLHLKIKINANKMITEFSNESQISYFSILITNLE